MQTIPVQIPDQYNAQEIQNALNTLFKKMKQSDVDDFFFSDHMSDPHTIKNNAKPISEMKKKYAHIV
jgi:hypothetical protein